MRRDEERPERQLAPWLELARALNAVLPPTLLPGASSGDSTRGWHRPALAGLAGRRPNTLTETRTCHRADAGDRVELRRYLAPPGQLSSRRRASVHRRRRRGRRDRLGAGRLAVCAGHESWFRRLPAGQCRTGCRAVCKAHRLARRNFLGARRSSAAPMPDGALFRSRQPPTPSGRNCGCACFGRGGLRLGQICRRLGARGLGLVSTEAKRAAARAAGADDVFLTGDDWPAQVQAATAGRGADVVYDSVGATLPDSFSTTRQGGRVVFYGLAGGNPPLIDPRMLMDTSTTLTGGDLWNVLIPIASDI